MKKRLITAVIMGIVLLPLILFTPEEVFMGVAALFAFVASLEMLRLYSTQHEYRLRTKIMIVALTMVVHLLFVLTWYWQKDYVLLPFADRIPGNEAVIDNQSLILLTSLFGISNMISIIVVGILLVLNKDIDTNDAAKIMLLVNYVGLGFASLAIIRMYSLGFIGYLLIVACFTDIFAYVFGMKFGKHKMAPVISPKKSWEGCVAGTVFGTVFGSLFAIFYYTIINSFPWTDATMTGTLFAHVCTVGNQAGEVLLIIGITFVVSIIGQIGDLVASKMKRDHDIKDFGRIFPGHGGVLDRFDSAIFIGLFLTVVCALLSIIFPLNVDQILVR